MKIVVNARLLRKNQMDGIGWFTYNTMYHIVKQNPHIQFHLLFDSGIDKEFIFADNVIPHNLFPPTKHPLLNIIWFEWSVRRALKKINPDLFLSPDGNLCLGWKGKQYGVVHDINFVHISEDLKWANRKYYNYFFPKYIQKASRLGTVSEYSKKDIVDTYKISPGKIDVVYSGINSFYEPVDEPVKKSIREKYANGNDFFIFVGTLHPRKNILRLMQAFELFKKRTSSNMKLLLVGREMYKTDEMHDLKNNMQYGQDVIFTGRISVEELKKLLAAAFCLTFVPYFEGFGLPPIEAMQCDVPVITSNVTSMPEVAGDAALLVDPYNVDDIAKAMEKLLSDPALRQALIQKGRIRKTVFSWERTAQLLWDSVSRVL